MITGALFLCFRLTLVKKAAEKLVTFKWIIWLSKNTLLVYFCHAILLNLMANYGTYFFDCNNWPWFCKYIFILLNSIGLTILCNLLVKTVKSLIKKKEEKKNAISERNNSSL